MHNYCDGSYRSAWSEGENQDDHGASITTEMAVEGTFIPYEINAWSGRVNRLGTWRHENGKTVFPITLDYNNIALYALQPGEPEKPQAAAPVTLLEGRNITGWEVTVERRTPGDKRDTRTETLFGATVEESAVQTVKTLIPVTLETLVGCREECKFIDIAVIIDERNSHGILYGHLIGNSSDTVDNDKLKLFNAFGFGKQII